MQLQPNAKVVRVLAAASLAVTCIGASFDALCQPETRQKNETELILLVDPMATDLPKLPEQLIDALERETGLASSVRTRLGNPSRIRPLISDRLSVATREGLPYSSPHRLIDSYAVLTYPTADASRKAHERLSADTSVKWVGPSRALSFSAAPTDPLYAGVSSSALDRQWGPTVLGLTSAWDQTPGTAYVGIVDNGILETHPDLTANYRAHFSGNFANTSAGRTPDEIDGSGVADAGHGTHVAGIIASVPNNGLGTAGVCWKCSLMVGKVSDYLNGGFTDFYAANGIVGLVRRGAQVLNMSFGWAFAANYCSLPQSQYDPFCVALGTAVDSDVVLVGAAGNHKSAVQFPASDPRVIAVGGMQVDGNPWDQLLALQDSPARNNSVLIGQEIGSNFGPSLALVAPARDILSTFYTGYNWSTQLRCGSTQSFASDAFSNLTASFENRVG